MKSVILVFITFISCRTDHPLDIVLISPDAVVMNNVEIQINDLDKVLESELCQDGKRIVHLSVPYENHQLISVYNLKTTLVPYKDCIKEIRYRRI